MKSRTSYGVETKLAPPQIYTNILARPRLFQLLGKHPLCRLIVVSAPAGYGKSTFLNVWGRQAATELVWVSLDEMDNDETRFWGAIVQAVVAIQPTILQRAMAILHFGEQLDSDALASTLISDLSEYEQDMTIVLDDYHVIHNASIHRLVEYVIQRIPNHVHMAILSRSALPFTIARLRAQGQVVEIGMNDLRFTGAEIRGFYRDVLQMNLTESVINEIGQMTEGWVSGLQLAAMMMRDEKNLSNPFQRFGGNHQMIAEFLHDEVLKAQPDAVQRFLLETSILNRLTESLCSAVTGIQDASEMLQRLQFTNSFVIALDGERVWFRYHQLFSDFLRHRLGIMNSGRVRELHQRAAAWFELQGFTVDAIEHAIAAEDFAFAARILESKSEELLHTGEMNTLLRWFERFPRHELAHYPLAQILHVWVLALSQRLEPALRLIDGLRESLLLGEDAESKEWTLELDVLRGYIAILQRHTALAVQFFTKSVQYVPKYSRFLSVGMKLNSGEPFVLPSRLGMRGYLRSTFELYTALRKIWKNSGLAILGYGSAALGELYYEWNDLDQLDYFIPRGIELGSTFEDVGILVPMHLLHAKYLRARRMRTEMWQCVCDLEDLIQCIPLNGHWQDIVLAFKVRIWLQENQMDDVASWLNANWENQYGHVTVVGEYGLITMARVLIYVRQLNAAIRLLGKLLQFAEMRMRQIAPTCHARWALIYTVSQG